MCVCVCVCVCVRVCVGVKKQLNCINYNEFGEVFTNKTKLL